MTKQIYVSLPVRDLDKSKDFFSRLGFGFEPRFTDQNAACLIIGENIFAMLLVEKFFKTFIKKEVCDARRSTEVLVALSAENKAEVDRIMDQALAAGGAEAREVLDYGWMYNRSFEDLDGHIWEIFYMDVSRMPEENKA